MTDIINRGAPPYVEHQKRVDVLPGHIAHFEQSGDQQSLIEAAKYKAELRNTQIRLDFDKAATAVIDNFGLTDEVRPDRIRYSDAIGFTAKVLHEVHNGETRSHYQRTYMERDTTGTDVRVRVGADTEKMKGTWDPAQDVIDHLGLTDETHVKAIRDLFATKGA